MADFFIMSNLSFNKLTIHRTGRTDTDLARSEMEIAEVTLAQIREKYSLPKTERDDAARFIAGISELL